MSPRGDTLEVLHDRTRHLAAIHTLPEACWPEAVERLVDNGWSVGRTKGPRRRRPPRWSNRKIARRLGVSDPTVADVRREMEAAGEVQKFSTRVGAVREELEGNAEIPQYDERVGAGGRGALRLYPGAGARRAPVPVTDPGPSVTGTTGRGLGTPGRQA